MTAQLDEVSYRVAVTSPSGETRLFVAHGLGLFGGTVEGMRCYLNALGEGWQFGEIERIAPEDR